MSADPNSVHVFISFSLKDQDLKNKLTKHIKILKRQQLISDWFDRDKIAAGEEPASIVQHHLRQADIILLLVSSDYISDDNIWDEEVESALARHEDINDPARVVPVILRPCAWQQMPFGKLMAAPQNGTPVISHPQIDDALTYVSSVIKTLADKIKAFKKANLGHTIPTGPGNENKTIDPKELEIAELTKLEVDLVTMISHFKIEIAKMAEGSQKFYLRKEVEQKEKELDELRQRKASLL